jgi:hypothetical protein
MNQFKRLISLANHLDSLNLFKEADILDDIIIRLAMGLDEARNLLEVSHGASNEEIQKAWKQKALEHHPDRGGDPEIMKQVNVARDILVGDAVPDKTHTPPTAPSVHKKDKMYTDEQTGDSFDQAISKADIPAGVKWKFATGKQYGTYGFDTNVSGFVVYGTTESEHVFVGIYNKRVANAFTHQNLDDHKVWVKTAPKPEPLSSVAPRIIRDLWNNFIDVKPYNAKVNLLSDDTTLSSHMGSVGKSISFKDAMDIMGEKTPESWKGRKLSLVFSLARGKSFANPNIVLIINGKEYPLSEKSNEWAWKTKPALPRYIVGEYAYDDSKKDMTRMDKGKASKALEVMIQRLPEWEPPELIEMLKQVQEQINKKKGE